MTRARSDYERGDSLDWRDHVGLAHKVATHYNAMILEHGLDPGDVIDGLVERIWDRLGGTTRPDGSPWFDVKRGLRPSTYIVPDLKGYLQQEIARQHGYQCWITFVRRRKMVTTSNWYDKVRDEWISTRDKVDPSPGPEHAIEQEERHEVVLGLLDAMFSDADLTPIQKRILHMMYADGLGYIAIGEALGISRQQARYHATQAVASLRDAAEDQGITPEDFE